jgi:2,4-dienoyl-CoA reductase (NADPH2)
VWCRLDAKELRIPGGITEEDGRLTAELAEAAGADAVHVSAYADPTSAIAFTDAPLVHEPGGFLPFAAAIKRRVGIPVIAVGRIEPEVGDAAIREGRCDFVAMGRKLLADPELPRRLAEGRPEAARPCVYAYKCVGNVFLREASRCVVNPALGREAELSPPAPPAAAPRRIAVVGGGPVGLELARVAAERGHAVTLYEREAALGGRARLAARLDAETARLVAWLERGARAAGVAIRLGEAANAAKLAGSADVFVIATGARREPELAPAAGAVRAEPVEEVGSLLEGPPSARRIAVFGSDAIGVKAAEALAQAGHAVTLLERGAFAPELGLPRRWRAADLLARLGAVRVRNVAEASLAERGVRWRTPKGEGEAECDLVLDATGLVPDEALAEALRRAGAEVHAIGDCRGPRYLEAGLLEAARLARAL